MWKCDDVQICKYENVEMCCSLFFSYCSGRVFLSHRENRGKENVLMCKCAAISFSLIALGEGFFVAQREQREGKFSHLHICTSSH